MHQPLCMEATSGDVWLFLVQVQPLPVLCCAVLCCCAGISSDCSVGPHGENDVEQPGWEVCRDDGESVRVMGGV